MNTAAAVAERFAELQQRIATLGGDDVTVIAVTKGFDAGAIEAAIAAGIGDIGENYAQELIAKLDAVHAVGGGDELVVPTVHFIGHVQSNKVRQLVGRVDVWHTVDRTSLIDALARRGVVGDAGEVMIQVNTTGEASKSGCEPALVAGLLEHAGAAGVTVGGLMTIGPTNGDRRRAAAAFRSLRRLADSLGLPSCSMGMSADYDIAVAEGATHVRVGTILFGERHRD